MTRIPSDEDFERVERQMREQSRNLDLVTTNVRDHFKSVPSFETFFILPQEDVSFRGYVFFKTDKDIEVCKSNGTVQMLIDFVYDELDRAGRGKREDITVAFEFDSDENVQRVFGGDYYQRLH